MTDRARTRRCRAAVLALTMTILTLTGGRTVEALPVTWSASGNVFDFSPAGGGVGGLTVTVREQPGLQTTTAGDGSWSLVGLADGAPATFVLNGPGRPTLQTATFAVAADLTQVSFQSPDQAMFDAMAALLGVTPDPTRCQIASTVTRRGHSLYDTVAGTHGEPDATVAIAPPPPGGVDGPVYFNLLAFNIIWPDRSLSATTADGGVLFTNVPPGTYTLTAAKAGATIRPVTVTCTPGVITNASPPWGLQVLTGGLDPDEVAPVPPSSTTAPTTTVTTIATTPASTAVPASTAAAPAVTAVPRFTG